MNSERFKARLVSTAYPDRKVIFNVSPEINETRSVNYKVLDLLHIPGQIYAYGNSGSRTFQLSNIKLISRTVEEATKNMRDLQLLSSWTLPYFGLDAAYTVDDFALQGAPPDVLYFSAYSDPNDCLNHLSNICKIPVFIHTLNYPFPTDCDYIETEDKQPFPTVVTVDIQLNETHSPREFSEFSLNDFRNGVLDYF